MLEHSFSVGWVTGIAVKPRRMGIYGTFTDRDIFHQMTTKKPGNRD